MKKLVLALIFSVSFNTNATQWCEKNVDKLQLFYINGMYTTADSFYESLKSLERFQEKYLKSYVSNGPVRGSLNALEFPTAQIIEVAKQKYEDMNKYGKEYQLITSIVGGYITELSSDQFSIMTPVLKSIMSLIPNEGITSEHDYRYSRDLLESTLRGCARTILIGHSQGNFYANALVNDVIYSFQYYDGVYLRDFPMLGYMGIASPANSVGGRFGDENPSLVGVLTNNNDIIMSVIRNLFGAVPANYEAIENYLDSSGHGLIHSYLESQGQATEIANNILSIANNLTPRPMFEQHPSSSSAISHIGYSAVSRLLDVRFRYGGGYRYSDVNKPVWDNFYYSTTHGDYFNNNIRNKYYYLKIED